MNQDHKEKRQVLTLPSSGNQKRKPKSFDYGKKQPVLMSKNGHEKSLVALKENGELTAVTLMSGISIRASVVGFDKYSIDLKNECGVIQTFFKHAIQSFQNLTQK